MNQFLPLIQNNSGFTLDDLKTEYRSRVKQVHPDTGVEGGDLFIRLKDDFDEACLLIDQASKDDSEADKNRTPLSRTQLRFQFFSRFSDFLRRGFLTSKEKIRLSYDYKKSLQAVRLSWALWQGPEDEKFDCFLSDFCAANSRSPTSSVWQRMNAFLYVALEIYCPSSATGLLKQKRILAIRNYEDSDKLISRIYNSFPALLSFLKFMRNGLDEFL